MDEEKWYKLMAMAVLSIGSFLSGLLPLVISEHNRRRYPLLISILLCFGAGILMATAMIHILPEVHEKMNSKLAEVSLCAGFFIIYFLDELLHYCFGEAFNNRHNDSAARAASSMQSASAARSNYGSLDSETAPLLATTNEQSEQHAVPHGDHESTHAQLLTSNQSEACLQAATGAFGLIVAMTVHSAIEGLAIGVQSSSTKVLFLLGAVSCHKFVMAFCLGLEFSSSTHSKLRSQLFVISVFALGVIIGIALGMLIVDIPAEWTSKGLPVIQALAGGSLLYVAACEVIPREKIKFHESSRKSAGLSQFLAVASGFTVMCLLNFYISDGD